MKSTKKFKKTNDSIITAHLGKLFGVPVSEDVRDMLRMIADSEHNNMPFDASRIEVVYERLPVIAEVLSTDRNGLFVDVMAETDDPVLWVDSLLTGRHSLFVVQAMPTEDAAKTAELWLSRMNDDLLQLIVGLRRGSAILAARVSSFAK